jgi:hypothetical protein
MSTFTVDGNHYTNFLEDEYTTKPILSGAYDVYFLLLTIYDNSQSKDIKTWVKTMFVNLFFNNTFKYTNKDFITERMTYAYDTRYYLTRLLGDIEQDEKAREFNYQQLNNMTYQFIVRKMNELDNKFNAVLGKKTCKKRNRNGHKSKRK